MPLPLATLMMSAIAHFVDKWRQSEINAQQALAQIRDILDNPLV